MLSLDHKMQSVLKEIQEDEEKYDQGLEKLLSLEQLDSLVFFACMLTERGRQRIDKLTAESSSEIQCVSAATVADRKTGLLELDAYIAQMKQLYMAEIMESDVPRKTISVIKQAYPDIFRLCSNYGPNNHTLLIYDTFRKRKAPEQRPAMESGSYYMIATIIWLCLAMGIELGRPDKHLAHILYECVYQDQRLYEYYFPLVEENKKESPSLADPLMPCLTIRCSAKITADIMRILYNVVRLAGADLDVVKLIESANIRADEEKCLGLIVKNRGFSEGDITAVFLVLRQFLQNQEHQASLLAETNQQLLDVKNALLEASSNDEKAEELQKQLMQSQVVSERQAKELQSMNQQNKGLRSELAAANRKVRELEDVIKAHGVDLEELSELRETLYHMMQDQSDIAISSGIPEADVTFPYTGLPEGVVVFGGHDQWRRGMGECFPTIRFVPINYRYDVSIIRNADCVWIHPGFMSHKMFYRIIRDARTCGTDVHYFRSRSVQSSARLIVERLGL
jgi:hypothetical protein